MNIFEINKQLVFAMSASVVSKTDIVIYLKDLKDADKNNINETIIQNLSPIFNKSIISILYLDENLLKISFDTNNKTIIDEITKNLQQQIILLLEELQKRNVDLKNIESSITIITNNIVTQTFGEYLSEKFKGYITTTDIKQYYNQKISEPIIQSAKQAVIPIVTPIIEPVITPAPKTIIQPITPIPVITQIVEATPIISPQPMIQPIQNPIPETIVQPIISPTPVVAPQPVIVPNNWANSLSVTNPTPSTKTPMETINQNIKQETNSKKRTLQKANNSGYLYIKITPYLSVILISLFWIITIIILKKLVIK